MATPESPESAEKPGSSIGMERLQSPGRLESQRPEASERSDWEERVTRLLLGPSGKSYVDYLESIKVKWPEYEKLRGYFEDTVQRFEVGWAKFWAHVQISDILVDGSFSDPHFFQYVPTYVHNKDKPESTLSTLENIKRALFEWPTTGRTRIVLLQSGGNHMPPDPLLLGLIGLALDIEPLFFQSLLGSKIPRHPEFLRMGPISMKIFQKVSTTSVPMSAVFVYFHDLDLSWDADCLYMINERPSFPDGGTQWAAPPRNNLPQPYLWPDDCMPDEYMIRVYQSMMCAQRNATSEEDLLQCLVIMARLHLVSFRKKFLDADRKYRGNRKVFFNEDRMEYYEDWGRLRRELELFQDSVHAFSRFITRHLGELKDSESMLDIKSGEEDALTEARALESEFRDTLQMNTSRLVLIESRNSIEEGKRVKLITILAFIFIPISLATSIFGMNVQQINNTGKDIWVFVVTALVLTILAISGWGLSIAIQWKWASMNHEKQPLSRRWSHILWVVLHCRFVGNVVLHRRFMGNVVPHRRFVGNFFFAILLGLMTDGRYGMSNPSRYVESIRQRFP